MVSNRLRLIQQLLCIFLLHECLFNVGLAKKLDALVHYSEFVCATPQQETTIAQRYELILDGSCSVDLNTIKAINPNAIWFTYNSGTDNYAPGEEHNWLVSRCVQTGVDSEVLYQHYYNDTRVDILGQVFFIPGWGGGSATHPSQARVLMYSSERNRFLCNYSNTNARQFYKEYNCRLVAQLPPSSNHYFDGVFFDNSADQLYNYGGILSGGAIAEHPTHALIGSPEYQSWHWANFRTFFSALKDTFALYQSWTPDRKPKYISAGTPAGAGIFDVVVLEFVHSPIRSWGNIIDIAANEDLQSYNQGTKIMYEARLVQAMDGYLGNVSYGQSFIDNLAFYYIIKSDSSYIFMSGPYQVYANGWDTLVWRGCMDFDIGEPLGPYNLNFYSGVDGRGYSFKVRSRQYQGALVLCRPRGDWYQHFDDATIVNVPLGGTYRPLNPNGTLGSPVASIPMRNGQGAILIPYSGSNTPPSAPTLASPPDGDTVTGRRPILTVNNAFDPDAIDNLTYFFEVYSNSGLTTLVASSAAVNQGSGTTSWTVNIDLQDSTTFWWRCRAFDGQAYSPWMSTKSFTVATLGTGTNNPPSAPTAFLPTNRDTVAAIRPALTVINSTDPDPGEVLVYEFQVFADSNLTNLVTSEGSVNQGNTYTSWTVNLDLQDSTIYWWRCRAFDGQAYSPWMAARSFVVLSGPVTVDSTAPVVKGPKNRERVAPGQAKLKVYPDSRPGSVYFFELANDTFMTGAIASPGIIPSPGDTVVEWTTPNSLTPGIYYWRSRVYRSSAYSDWSQVVSFEVANFNPYAYPNPFKPSEGATVITFADLPPGSNLKIATVSGELVYQIKLGTSDTQYVWNVKNQDGKELASGVYLYSISYPGGTTSGKLAVIK